MTEEEKFFDELGIQILSNEELIKISDEIISQNMETYKDLGK